MTNQKILNKNQVSWYEDGSTRLNYQMIFNDDKVTEEKIKSSPDIAKKLEERDEKWKRKVERSREEALAEGYEKGLQEGLAQARAEIDSKLSGIRNELEQARLQWQEHQKMLEPGILDMVFEISEAILGIPVENPKIRETLELKLGKILQRIDESSKPLLLIAEDDYEYIKNLVEELTPNTAINIRTNNELKPGEFKLETKREDIVHKFEEMLKDFRTSLTLPSWK